MFEGKRCHVYLSLESTTPNNDQPLGWAKIVHPFHPLKGQKFEILKKKKMAGEDIFSLRGISGVFSIPKSWTDHFNEISTPFDTILSPACLLKLSELVTAINSESMSIDKC